MKEDLDKYSDAYKGNILYDFDNKIVLKWYAKRIISLTKNTESILELGLGHGFTARIFSNIYKNYTILEGSPDVINNFNNSSLKFHPKIIETYFEDFKSHEKYDVIVMGFILEHVDDPLKILKYYKKFLSPNGRLFVSVPNAESMNRQLGNYSGILENIFELSENDLKLGHKRYYCVETLKKELELAGYLIEKIEGIFVKPFTTSQILSLNLDERIINSLCQIGIKYPELSSGILMECKTK